MAERLLKVSTVADRLQVTPRQVDNFVARGELVKVRLGGSARIPESSVTEFIARVIGQATGSAAGGAA